MKWIVAALGLLLVIAGAIAIQDGISIIQVERGWTGVISGTVALSAGVIVLGVAAVLAQLDRIAALLADAAFASAIADAAPRPSAAPESMVVRDAPRTLGSRFRPTMHKQEQVDDAPLTPVPPIPLDVAVEPLPVRTEEAVSDDQPAPVARAAPGWPSEQATSFADRLKQMKDKREETRDRRASDKREAAADTKPARDFQFKFPPVAPRFGGERPQPESVVPSPVDLRGTLHQESSDPEPVPAAEPELFMNEEVAQPVAETMILEQASEELEPAHAPPPPEEKPLEQRRESPLFNQPWRTAQKQPAAPVSADDEQDEPELARNDEQRNDDQEAAHLATDERSLEELEAMVAELEAQAAELQDVEAAFEQKAADTQEHLTEETEKPEATAVPEPAKPEQSWARPIVPEPPPAPIGSADWLERALSGVDEEPAPPPFVPKIASRFAPEPQPAPPVEAAAEEATVIGRYQTDGTAYVMYSDGSIDAETDRGAFRFGSLAELKAFIERSA